MFSYFPIVAGALRNEARDLINNLEEEHIEDESAVIILIPLIVNGNKDFYILQHNLNFPWIFHIIVLGIYFRL